MIRVAFVVVALTLASQSIAQEQDAAPAKDCSVYSLEGVSLGMTLDEAKAATSGWKWKDRNDNGMVAVGRGDFWTARKKGAWLGFNLLNGRVTRIERSYFDLSPAAVMASFRTRFGERGPESSRVQPSRPGYVTTTTAWVDSECNAMAWVEEGTYTHTTVTVPALLAGVMDLDAVGADVAAEGAGVKF